MELAEYPGEKLRNYILDIVFASFVRLKQHTLQWLEIGLQGVEETILNPTEKQDMLRHLNDIDVNNLKLRNKDDSETDKIDKITRKFSDVFDFFEYR